MNLIKVREIRGPRNEFLQKSTKSKVRGMNFYKSLQKLLWLFMFLLMARGTSSESCPMQQFWVAALVFCHLAAYFGLSTTYSHISPMWPGTTPITSNTLQGSCRKQKATYYVKPLWNYEITIARKIFFKLKDTSEHSMTM